jgi:hypothetical protein
MVDLIPRLKNLRVRRTWRGLYPMTPDAFPIIGWTKEVEGCLLAAGWCGQGFMLGPGVGEMLVRMVLKTQWLPFMRFILLNIIQIIGFYEEALDFKWLLINKIKELFSGMKLA